ncbi:LutC/YkgG family protein [Schaalia suimastitidis]|uniref:LutC/YkgG family protein n=1 Tax=Schaalia suimastitidis TaxID=121163 RepID=UPI0003FCC2DF|nr:LUD domain-containing protein [Schaalia suimastitidis]
MSDKQVFLAAVRAALAASSNAPTDTVVRTYRCEGEEAPGSAQVVAEFIGALEDYGVEVKEVPSEGVADAVADFLSAGGVTSVVIPAGLDEAWAEAAGRSPRVLHVDSVDSPCDKALLADVDAVVTASRVAVSLSGAIALDGQSDQGRRVITLLPDLHICVVNSSAVYPTMPQAVAVLAQHPERPTTWIAGGSATSDIELVRVNGVHGPRTLRVVLVSDR